MMNWAEYEEETKPPEKTMLPYRLWAVVISILLGLALAGVFHHAQAEGDWLVVHGLAKHLDGEQHCNSTTSGLGYERDFSRNWRAMAGVYRNSNCRYSSYAGGAYTPLHIGTVSFGALAGGVTGYKVSPMPAAGFVATVDGEKAGLTFVLIPPFKDSGNVLWASVKFRW